MPDEAPAVEQDQPQTPPEAPETDQPTGGEEESSFTDSFNPNELPEEARTAYEAAYKQLQGDYTRKTQTLAEERRESEEAQRIVDALLDDRTAPQMLAALGWELDGEGPEAAEPEYVDPDERIDQLEGRLSQREQFEFQAAQEAAQDDQIAEELEVLEGKANRQFDPEEVALLSTQAHATGQPVEEIYKHYDGLLAKRHEEWKEARKAPRRLSPGSAGSRQVDRSNPEERRKLMAEAADAVIASE